MMQNTIRKRHYYNQTQLYEIIFNKLRLLAPTLHILSNPVVYRANKSIEFRFEAVEKHKYTIIAQLSINLPNGLTSIPNITMTIRIYHDAQVAEVASYQQERSFMPDYDYPNPKMRHRDEKHQINRLLCDWLDYFLMNGNQACHHLANTRIKTNG